MFQIVYFVTSSVSANTFGYNQMLSLVEQGYSVHLICGDGYLKEEIRIIEYQILNYIIYIKTCLILNYKVKWNTFNETEKNEFIEN